MIRRDHNNHPGKVILAIIPMALVCVTGWIAEHINRLSARLDAACYRGIGRIERWAERKERP